MTIIKFWTEPDSMGNLVKRVVGSYIIDNQRSLLCEHLQEELSLHLLMTTNRGRAGWFPGDAVPPLVTPIKQTQLSPGFNAYRKGMENNTLQG